jgi:hypothetical protein
MGKLSFENLQKIELPRRGCTAYEHHAENLESTFSSHGKQRNLIFSVE